MPKTLLVYYSRTGSCKAVAEKFAEKVPVDMEEIAYKNGGKVSFLAATKQAAFKQVCEISGDDRDPSEYDNVILVTPVWAGSVATPIRSYVEKHKEVLRQKDYFIVTCSSVSLGEKVADEMAELLQKRPISTQSYLTKDVKNNHFVPQEL